MTKNLLMGSKKQLFQCLFLSLGFLSHNAIQAQPPNDSCADAYKIAVGNNGFAKDTFTSDTFNISNATLSSSQVPSSISNKMVKDMWFKFTIPTKRKVKYAVRQPTNNIPNNNVSFAIYDTNGCTPTNTHPALPPKTSFSSRTKNCMLPGTYYIRVGVPNSVSPPVKANIYVELTISNGSIGGNSPMPYDFASNREQLGVIDSFQKNSVQVSCHSIDNTGEMCPNTLSNAQEYTQSTWHTFETDDYLDHLAVKVNANSGNNHVFGYRLYQGDVQNTSPGNMSKVTTCTALNYSPGNPYPTQHYGCDELQPDTTYTIQLLYKTDFANQIDVTIRELGKDSTQAPKPDSSWMSSNNILGDITDTTQTLTDYFGCNGRLDSTSCGIVNPVNGVSLGGTNYDLATWITFSTTDTSKIHVQGQHPSFWGYYCRDIAGRVFKDTVTNTCSDIDTGNLVATFSNGDDFSGHCLPPGHYTVQLLGRKGNNLFNCSNSNFGRSFNISVSSNTNIVENEFSLVDTPRVDSINNWQPLTTGTTYYAQRDTFGCDNTVMPAGSICNNNNTKASYRVLNIGDNTPGNSQPDSGILYIDNLNTSYPFYLQYGFYKGNAQQLALSQNVNDFPSTISNLEPQKTSCITSSYTQRFCVTDTFYSFVSMAKSDQIDVSDNPSFSLKSINTTYDSPANAENLDTLSPGDNVSSSIDHFSCINNADSLGGVPPCNPKAIYREFYLDSAAFVEIKINPGFYGTLQIFEGQATIVQGTVDTVGYSGCRSNLGYDQCSKLNEGWYTVVAYGDGPSYSNPHYSAGNGGDIGKENQISVETRPDTLEAKYNRPYKACIANGGNPLEYDSSVLGTPYPDSDTTYTLCTEFFVCESDSPLADHPIQNSCGNYNSVAYYRFDISQESFVIIHNIPASYHAKLYNLDVTKDSALMPTTTPVQPCLSEEGFMQLCRLQPGEYTLVVFADDSYIHGTLTPKVYIDAPGVSRFDSTANAYDFGNIPGNNQWYEGKPGGSPNPLNSARAPSNDFFYCTTGADSSDPNHFIYNGALNPNVYPDTQNNVLFYDSTVKQQPRRNLWYTFKLKGKGFSEVKVNNMSADRQNQYQFAIYESDLPCNASYDSLINSMSRNQIQAMKDSLTLVKRNIDYSPSLSFLNPVPFNKCDGQDTCKRYFIVVENNPHFSPMWPNHQVEVEIRFDAVEVRYDYYNSNNDTLTANVINGLQEVKAPYQDSSLNYGCYEGAPASFVCATSDFTDPSGSCDQTLWYKFETKKAGRVRVNFEEMSTNNRVFNSDDIMLLKQGPPGGSSGLTKLSLDKVQQAGHDWGEACLDSGTYYIHMTGCNYDFETVKPHVCLDRDTGDYCHLPLPDTLNGVDSITFSKVINCHTMGGDFGEDSSNMNCLNRPSGFKSSWFKIELTDSTNSYDINVELRANTQPIPTIPNNPIRYRVLAGNDCSNLLIQDCGVFGTSFTLTCKPSGTYYVQVTSPAKMTGDIELDVSTSINTNPDCNPSIVIPGFDYQNACNSDSVYFTNLSTQGGSNIQYLWDFDHGGQTSDELHPSHVFPMSGNIDTYQVSLTVTDTSSGNDTTITKPVTVYPLSSLGPDTTLCQGQTYTLDASYPNGGGTFTWQDGARGKTYTVNTGGLYWAEDSLGCRDSAFVDYTTPPVVHLGNDTTLCEGQTHVLDVSQPNAQNPQYQWQDGSTNATYTVASPGTYAATVTKGACTRSSSITVAYDSIAIPHLSDTLLCQGETIQLDAAIPNATYNWSTSDTTRQIVVDSAGDYRVRVERGACTVSDTASIQYQSPPSVDLGNDTTLCEGDQLLLDGSVNAPQPAYKWYDGDTLSTDTISNAGQYWVDVHLVACSASDTIDVAYDSPPSLSLQGDTICENDSVFLNASIPNANYQWSTNSSDSVIVVDQTDNYWVRVDSGACTIHDTAHVQVDTLPIKPLENHVACDGDTVTLNAYQDQISFHWSTGDTTPAIDITSSDTAWVTLTNRACQIRDTSFVHFDTIPQFSLGNDRTLCQGDTLYLDVSGKGTSYQWSHGPSTPGTSLTTAGGYTVTITDGNGCQNEDSISLDFYPAINLNVNGTNPLCFGGSSGKVFANATGGWTSTGFWYQWEGPRGVISSDSSVSGLEAGQYIVTATDNQGCTASDTVILTNPDSLAISDFSYQDIRCNGSDDGEIGLEATGGTGSLYYSIDSGQIFAESSVFTELSDGNYRPVVMDANGCRAELGHRIVINEPEPIRIDLQPDSSTVKFGKSVEFNTEVSNNATRPWHWRWMPTDDLSCVDCKNPTAAPCTDTEYALQLEDDNGCIARDTTYVDVLTDKKILYVPNAFTPDGNGNNDTFRIFTFGVKEIKLTIFNRWGELIFETTDPTAKWDGTYQGDRIKPGTYTYNIYIKYKDDERVKKRGSVTLIR